jgi:hypothetical protein
MVPSKLKIHSAIKHLSLVCNGMYFHFTVQNGIRELEGDHGRDGLQAMKKICK